MVGYLVGQVVVASHGDTGAAELQKLDHLPVAARIDQCMINTEPVHPRHPLACVGIVGGVDRRPASLFGGTGDEVGQQLGRARALLVGQPGQEIAASA